MNTPKKGMGIEEFTDAYKKEFDKLYEKNPKTGEANCKKCGTVVLVATMYVSVHAKDFSECTGFGECEPLPLPYCPKCEGKPEEIFTCVHV